MTEVDAQFSVIFNFEVYLPFMFLHTLPLSPTYLTQANDQTHNSITLLTGLFNFSFVD